mmetsp:Transcript_68090/g.215486  ORF Transcript_68090/g.215486 Transcript_68090/m.215486 type:complete len:599 (+) Transcript_68090:55-1851(+)
MAVLASLPGRDASTSTRRLKAHLLRLDPQSIVRAAVYIQAAVRRFLVEDAVQILEISPPVPSPPVAVGVFFSRRLQKPLSGWALEEEAMGVAAVICGRERGLTLGPIVAALDQYSPVLPQGHPVLEMLLERFREVAVEGEEELLRRLRRNELPSKGYACLREFCEEWGAPEESPDGGPLFQRAHALIAGLKPAMEERLTRHLDHCQTMAGFTALEAEVDRELGDGYPLLRTRVRNGKRAHHEHVKHRVQSLWGWPPTGSPEPLARSSRWYAAELGAEHPVVEDFAEVVVRILKKAEDSARKELEPIDKCVAGLREKLGGHLGPPKLVADSLNAELQEQMVAALESFQRWHHQLGCESQVLFAYMRSILGDEAMLLRWEEEADKAAAVLRRPDPGPFGGAHGAAEAEDRLAASVRICQIEAGLGGLASSRLRALSAEFASELAAARPLVPLLRPSTPLSVDDGWHRPPGFAAVEARAGADGPPPAAADLLPEGAQPEGWDALPPPQEPEAASSTVSEEPAVTARMRLHGVGLADARSRCEILLMERCAAIIAEECGIPREWVSNVAFVEPPAKVGPRAARLDAVAEEGELAGSDSMTDG